MPEHGLAKNESERHFVDERFQSARRFAFPSEIGVRPPPEVPMPVSAVMSLYSESQGIACEPAAIQRDLARKYRIRMWCARESYPPFAAQYHLKIGLVLQVPFEMMTVNIQRTATVVLSDFVFARLEMKRNLRLAAEIQLRDRKSLNETSRHSPNWKPGSPDLNWSDLRRVRTPRPPGIH